MLSKATVPERVACGLLTCGLYVIEVGQAVGRDAASLRQPWWARARHRRGAVNLGAVARGEHRRLGRTIEPRAQARDLTRIVETQNDTQSRSAVCDG